MSDIDFTIIGSGAGGSVAGNELLNNGYSVEIFEEGINFNNQTMSLMDSISNLWRNNGINLFHGNPILNFGEGKCVGGSTVINGGVIARTDEKILYQWDNLLGENFFLNDDFFKECQIVENNLIPESKNSTPENVSNSSKILIDAAKKKNYITKPAKLAFNNINIDHNKPFGCNTGTKNSLDKNYHKNILNKGGKIISGTKVLKIIYEKNVITKIIVQRDNAEKLEEIKINNLIISAGPTQTPKLLINNGLAENVNPLNFHMNLKILCLYEGSTDCEKSSLLTHHVREFEDDGVLFMASNYIKPLIASYLNFLSTEKIKNFMANYHNGSVFNCQIKPDFSNAKIKKTIFGNNINISWELDQRDFFKIKKYLKILVELVFISGAKKVILPIENCSEIFSNLDDAKRRIDLLKKKNLEITSVHAMSSCSMNRDEQNITNSFGKLKNFKNAHILDASILPSNTGQHPQLTIMSTVSKLIKRNIDNKKFNL
jgi:choline dehydrogenase-like flavoprotein